MRLPMARLLIRAGCFLLGGAVGSIVGYIVGYYWRGPDFVYDQSEDVIPPLFFAAMGGCGGSIAGICASTDLIAAIKRRRNQAIE